MMQQTFILTVVSLQRRTGEPVEPLAGNRQRGHLQAADELPHVRRGRQVPQGLPQVRERRTVDQGVVQVGRQGIRVADRQDQSERQSRQAVAGKFAELNVLLKVFI